MNATVKDVMSTHVTAVRETATFKEIATRLREQRVSAFPVVGPGGKVIGVVSEADLLAKEALEGTVPSTLQSLTHQRVRSQVNALTAADLNVWALLVPAVAGVVIVWALALAHDAGYPPAWRLARDG